MARYTHGKLRVGNDSSDENEERQCYIFSRQLKSDCFIWNYGVIILISARKANGARYGVFLTRLISNQWLESHWREN